MDITDDWLREHRADPAIARWMTGRRGRGMRSLARELVRANRFEWAVWLVTEAMSDPQRLAFAAFAVERGGQSVVGAGDDLLERAIRIVRRCARDPLPEARDDAARVAEALYRSLESCPHDGQPIGRLRNAAFCAAVAAAGDHLRLTIADRAGCSAYAAVAGIRHVTNDGAERRELAQHVIDEALRMLDGDGSKERRAEAKEDATTNGDRRIETGDEERQGTTSDDGR